MTRDEAIQEALAWAEGRRSHINIINDDRQALVEIADQLNALTYAVLALSFLPDTDKDNTP